MRVVGLLVAFCLLTSALVDWRMVQGTVDIPMADLLAMGISGAYGLYLLLSPEPLDLFGVLRGEGTPAPLAVPAAGAWSLFLGACLAGCVWVHGDGQMYYFVARKPFFCWMAYGVGLAGVVRLLPAAWLRTLGYVQGLWLAGLILPPAIWLILHGLSGSFLELPGMINNHKLLAVALAPWLGALARWLPLMEGRWRRYSVVILGIAGVAVLLSMSKAAWISAAFGLVAFVEWRGRPLLARPLPMVGVALSGVAGMMALPFLTGDPTQADTFDSRWSLNVRAWIMFRGEPLFGYGPGTATRWLMNDPRHYRIDGVDAHGVFQKVAGENGVVGLVPYLAAYLWFLRFFWKAALQTESRYVQGAAILGLGLHLNLLLSTDYFSSAHWGPLAIALGVVARRES